jgi:hypothetical protein
MNTQIWRCEKCETFFKGPQAVSNWYLHTYWNHIIPMTQIYGNVVFGFNEKGEWVCEPMTQFEVSQ